MPRVFYDFPVKMNLNQMRLPLMNHPEENEGRESQVNSYLDITGISRFILLHNLGGYY